MQAETMANAATSTRTRADWIRTIAYWTFTIPIVWEMVAGSLWDALQIEYVRVILKHLGYPLYIDYVLGPLKLAGAAVVLAPRFPRLKEWAYAGFFFNYYGATASHLLAGDGPSRWAGPLPFLAFTLASWALRPADRRVQRAKLPAESRPLDWAIPIAIILVLLALSYVTLPKGPPPGY
jgi:hypothetical protein